MSDCFDFKKALLSHTHDFGKQTDTTISLPYSMPLFSVNMNSITTIIAKTENASPDVSNLKETDSLL